MSSLHPYHPPSARCRAGVARRDVTPPVGIQSPLLRRRPARDRRRRPPPVHRHRPGPGRAGTRRRPDAPARRRHRLAGEGRDGRVPGRGARAARARRRPAAHRLLPHPRGREPVELHARPARRRQDPPLLRAIDRPLRGGRRRGDRQPRTRMAHLRLRHLRPRPEPRRVGRRLGQFVTGFNPDGEPDDTVLVARVSADDGSVLATLVNYGCHPTTLGPTNRLLSRTTSAPCAK